MDVNIEFSDAAFKHGISESAIRRAIGNFIYDDTLPNDKKLLLGFDGKAHLLEVVYNVIDEETIKIFHAMKCRKEYLALLDD
ncbi:MAG: hypothetical protein LBT01_04225 [Spirochaetaceae bacterium]|jgi:hypothetical protein|nr:hypothetical protein [Spirochaetaceae bacterium]